jgi:uncharacterized glyoxalase superfamily protein PhnB
MTGAGEQAKQNLKRVMPLLQVSHMLDTLTYYQDVLGFALDYAWPSRDNPTWSRVSRESVSFMLTVDLGTSSGQFIAEKGNGVVLYVIAGDVEALYAELVAREALIVQDIHTFGDRKQFSVADPNGYVIAFSQEFA